MSGSFRESRKVRQEPVAPGGNGNSRRGASGGEANPKPQATRPRVEKGLEVEALGCGSRFRPVSVRALNDKEAVLADEVGNAARREKPLDEIEP